MHYEIAMNGDGKDPINSGSMRSWFFYYKWLPDEEGPAFFPIPESAGADIKPGDTIWFKMDEEIVGSVTVTQVMDDDMNDRREIWFDFSGQRPHYDWQELPEMKEVIRV